MGLVGGRDRACPVGLHAAAVLALPAARVALWPSPARVLRLRRARRAGALRGGPQTRADSGNWGLPFPTK